MQQNAAASGDATTASAREARRNESIEARIDALLSPAEAARARARLHTAEPIVDAEFTLSAAMRSAAAFVAHQYRSVFVSSPRY